MRLIDAGELLKTLQNLEPHSDNEVFEHGMLKMMRYYMPQIINDEPTAYDVDKVVEHLKKLNKYNLNLADRMLDIQSNGLGRHFICLEDAVEIVKAGEVDGN
jgi:hypothetical protein